MNRDIKERLDSTSKLINTGKWDKALEQARVNSEASELAPYVRTWFQLVLIEGLHGTPERRVVACEKVMQCNDYSEELEGDLLRDDAIVLMKAQRLKAARKCVDRAKDLHRHDQNRMVCLEMVDGRIQLHSGRYDEAYSTLLDAASKWRKMGDNAHRQWQINLQLHLLMAAVMSDRNMRAWLLLPRLVWTDRNRRRWVAALMCLSSKRRCASVLHHH